MAEPPNERDHRQVIRITHAEAMSSRVDDLLKRQMSLRGESGIAYGSSRWYLQNWFVLMVIGSVMAFLAWALLEPYFDDSHYIQGQIDRMDTLMPLPNVVDVGGEYVEIFAPARGWVEINGERVWLLQDIRDLDQGNNQEKFDPSSLSLGQEIALYTEFFGETDVGLALARYIDTTPPSPPPSKAKLSLYRQSVRSAAVGMLLFAVVAGAVGLGLGAADGIICRLPRRAFLGAAVGLIVGLLGGLLSRYIAGLVYSPLNSLAMQDSAGGIENISAFSLVIQIVGRGLGWMVAGMAMGLGTGIALRSKRLLLYGFLGGIIGGLLGGLLFDPIDLLLLGPNKPDANFSRMVGLTAIGACVGLMIGLVELFVRDIWLRMVEGPLAGKEFLLFRDVMTVGSSPHSAIYLFNDPDVASHHATLRTVGDRVEIENHSVDHPLLVNDRRITHTRLRHGDKITVGRAIFVFENRKGA